MWGEKKKRKLKPMRGKVKRLLSKLEKKRGGQDQGREILVFAERKFAVVTHQDKFGGSAK